MTDLIEKQVADGNTITITFEKDPNPENGTPVRMKLEMRRPDDRYDFGFPQIHKGPVTELLSDIGQGLELYLKMRDGIDTPLRPGDAVACNSMEMIHRIEDACRKGGCKVYRNEHERLGNDMGRYRGLMYDSEIGVVRGMWNDQGTAVLTFLTEEQFIQRASVTK